MVLRAVSIKGRELALLAMLKEIVFFI